MVQANKIEVRHNPSQEYAFFIDDHVEQTIPRERQEERRAMNTPEIKAECRKRLKAAGLWR